jgi:hypothetical protein
MYDVTEWRYYAKRSRADKKRDRVFVAEVAQGVVEEVDES